MVLGLLMQWRYVKSVPSASSQVSPAFQNHLSFKFGICRSSFTYSHIFPVYKTILMQYNFIVKPCIESKLLALQMASLSLVNLVVQKLKNCNIYCLGWVCNLGCVTTDQCQD